MGQTCSLPCVDFLEESARVFAFPQYSATGCGAATYSSFLVVRSDLPGEELAEFAGATATVNDPHFQSGHTSLVMELERGGHRMPFFGRARVSRAHSASIRMLAEGAADIAAIDCVSYAHFQRNGDPDVGAVRIIGRTPEAPAPPYITFGSREPDINAILYESLCEAWRIRKPDPRARYCSSRRRFSRMRRSMQEWKRFVLRGVERAKRELRGSGFLPASAAELGQIPASQSDAPNHPRRGLCDDRLQWLAYSAECQRRRPSESNRN